MAVTTIHFIWLQGEEHLRTTKPKLNEYIKSWDVYFPSWEKKIWDADSIVQILDKSLPPAAAAYKRAKLFAHKADIARYGILTLFGGMYADTDMECLENFENLLDPHRFTAIFDSGAISWFARLFIKTRSNNCWMYSPRAQHPACIAVMDAAVNNVNGASDAEIAMSSPFFVDRTTGPQAFYAALKGREDVSWIPTNVLDPVGFRLGNYSAVPAAEFKALFPDAKAIHRAEMSWVGGNPRFWVNIVATFYQGATMLAIIFFIIMLVFIIAFAVCMSSKARLR